MENKYSQKQLEELYNCGIDKCFGLDDCHLFYVALGYELTKDGDDALFYYADGWTLDELHENIRKRIYENIKALSSEEEIRADERAKVIEEFATKMCEAIDKDNASGWRTSKDDVLSLKVAMLEQNCAE